MQKISFALTAYCLEITEHNELCTYRQTDSRCSMQTHHHCTLVVRTADNYLVVTLGKLLLVFGSAEGIRLSCHEHKVSQQHVLYKYSTIASVLLI